MAIVDILILSVRGSTLCMSESDVYRSQILTMTYKDGITLKWIINLTLHSIDKILRIHKRQIQSNRFILSARQNRF